MTALARSTAKSTLLPALMAFGLGLGVITVAGHVQATALHDAAHDARHANGFPCH
ncbi:CbtB-domain containing protein [Roseovarius spongiae]|uniref:CbtB-domain containing protein n=1 Tax=Roseovarius spongiae TaxID=2320272 RepID=A0A3A8ASZ4_9RHOB|nr:CbtB domain-containing protein [Roseovarius spongiae]RKF14659.1 CbtB-domain containing protein [Roseovarius spongiae]